MDVGLIIPTRGPLATPSAIATLARRAEELGFAHFSTSDHLVVPRSIGSRYPYSASGTWPGAASGDCLDLLTLLAYLAALTTQAAPDHRGRGGALSRRRPHRQDRRHHRRAVRRPHGDGRRRRLAQGGVRGAERAAVRGARPGHRRVAAGLQDPLDRGGAALRGPPRQLRRTSASCPSPCRSRTRRSGSAARARRRCGARCATAMPGSRSATTRAIRSTPWRASRPASSACTSSPSRTAATPSRIGIAFYAGWYDETKTLQHGDGERHIMSGTPAQIAEDIAALQELGVARPRAQLPARHAGEVARQHGAFHERDRGRCSASSSRRAGGRTPGPRRRAGACRPRWSSGSRVTRHGSPIASASPASARSSTKPSSRPA